MKVFTLIWLTLFPYLHNERYVVEYAECVNNTIILEDEGEQFQVTLFNVKMKNEKGINYACDVLKDAKEVSFELDPTSQIKDPFSVYLFVDGELLQEVLLKQNYAYIMIHNPEYLYYDEMEEASKVEPTISNNTSEHENNYQSKGYLFLIVLVLVWGINILLVLRMRHQKKK